MLLATHGGNFAWSDDRRINKWTISNGGRFSCKMAWNANQGFQCKMWPLRSNILLPDHKATPGPVPWPMAPGWTCWNWDRPHGTGRGVSNTLSSCDMALKLVGCLTVIEQRMRSLIYYEIFLVTSLNILKCQMKPWFYLTFPHFSNFTQKNVLIWTMDLLLITFKMKFW